MKNILLLYFLFISSLTYGQSYFNGLYTAQSKSYGGQNYNVYTFSREGGKIKAKYFAKNTNSLSSLKGKKVLFYCAANYTVTWDKNSDPIGICVDGGMVLNRKVDDKMDGLVVMYNSGVQEGGIAISNLDKEPINTSAGSFWIRNNSSDKTNFLNWAKSETVTVFQTHLLYSSKGYEFPLDTLTNGNKVERRFLAVCKINGVVKHVVVDSPQADYLNKAAKNVVEMLQSTGYTIIGLLNLETGGRNVMTAGDDKGNTISSTGKLEDAINLIIYYMD